MVIYYNLGGIVLIKVVGVDSGNKYLKAVKPDETVIFQNIATEGKSSFDTEMPVGETKEAIKQLDVIITRPDGSQKRYWVGDFAVKQDPNAKYVEEKNKLNSEYGIATCLTALAILAKDDSERIALGTGLPVSDHKTNIKESYNHIIGKYKVEFASGPWKGIVKDIEIVAVKTYQQGLGIFLDQVLTDDFDDPQEYYDHPLINDGVYALIDVGSKTTNFHIFEDGTINLEKATSINSGINLVHNALINAVTRKGIDVPMGRDEQLITFDEFAGSDLKQIREEAIETLINHIKRQLNTDWSEILPWINKYYVAGGAGQYIYDHLSLDGESKLVKRPQLANAYGFLKALCAAIVDGKVLDSHGKPVTLQYENPTD